MFNKMFKNILINKFCITYDVSPLFRTVYKTEHLVISNNSKFAIQTPYFLDIPLNYSQIIQGFMHVVHEYNLNDKFFMRHFLKLKKLKMFMLKRYHNIGCIGLVNNFINGQYKHKVLRYIKIDKICFNVLRIQFIL